MMPSPSEEPPQISEKDTSSDTSTAQDDSDLVPNKIEKRRSTDTSSGRVEDDGGDILAAVPDVEVDLENGEGAVLKRAPSNVIPRNKRRGLFAQLVIGIPEIDDPVQYSPKTKNFIVFVIAFAAIAAPMGYVPTEV
jgi:hypothetical protein